MAESFVGCDGDNPTKPPDEPRDNSTKHPDESTNVKDHDRTLDIYEEEDRFGNKIEYQVYREKILVRDMGITRFLILMEI